MTKFNNAEVKQVLVFNSTKKLIAVFYSALATAKALGTHTQSVHYACTGKCIAIDKLYMRHLFNEIEITFEDLGKLRLEEYDELCGIKRKVYPNRKMRRKGMKYNKNKSKTNQNESTDSK
jgi:hypothetical protein